MNNNPLISFILPNYNNEHVLDLFFEKFIFHNTYDNYEFIIVDDGSEDHSLEILYKWKNSGKIKDMMVIEEPHLGIINALNKALFLAKGEFVIRCDGDATIETSSFVEKFLEFYYINPEKIGVITSKVISDTGWLHALGRMVISDKGLLDNGKEPIEPIGRRKWDFLTSPIQHLSDMLDIPVEVDTALGVFTFFKKDIALKIGGFDKNFPLWIEDDDFFLSFRLFNKKCFYLPCIEVCHRFSLRGSRNPNNWKKRYANFIRVIDDEIQLTRSYYFKKIKFFKRRYISWRPKILLHDYNYWKQKWGFDCLNPDMEVVKKLYKNTEILWNYDVKLKHEGDWIINEYIKKLNQCRDHDVKILVGYHKKAPLINSNILTPLFLGKESWSNFSKDGKLESEDFQWMCEKMIGDNTGENISELNRFFCEMTGVYWIWKNYEKINHPKYIGFMQYRRHLKFGQNYFSCPSLFYKDINSNYLVSMGLLDKVIIDTIEDYDILCVKPLVLGSSVFEQFRELENLPFDLDFKIFEEVIDYIKEYYVDYRAATNEYMNNNKHYWYNCFVMKKELFEDFCSFVFPIMFYFHNKIDYSRMSIAGKRILGFISERLYGIFLTKQIQNQVKIKQLSLSLIENLEYTEATIDPKFTKNNIPIVFFVNKSYLTYLHVLLLSLLKHISSNFNYDILVFLSGDIDEYHKKLFLDLCCENVSIRFYNSLNIVQNYINNDELMLHANFYSKDTYYRLLIPKILKNFDKVIYLDADLIILDDIAKFFISFNSEDMAIGAVKSYDVIRAIRLKTITNSENFDLGNYLDSIGLENKYNYFQAGVLVFNNKKLNEIGFVDSAMEMLKKTDKFLLQDQDILNILLENRVQFLDSSFNIEWHVNFALYNLPLSCQLPEQDYIDYVNGYNCPKILHYSSAIKPWKNPDLKYADIWWKYARESGFYEKFIFETFKNASLCCDHGVDHVNSAVYRIKNRLSYRIGELLLKTNTPKQFLLLPFNLLKIYIKFKQYQNYFYFYVRIHAINLNSLESCNDYQEAVKIQQHWTYILGNLFVSNPFTFVFKVGKAYKRWKIKKGKK